ncbi:hypothetical protein JTE90_006092 [Oedothorax gibbosus]|uniref:Rho GTPase-activating protein 44 n=1 Tax=Oedothorax gibbosus TaxID=931172 RepID=A0AAV6V4X4_9ARAC|nr:hypothetical protein JTE90_006092 [Oedothorax gibbosus]
MKKQFLRVKQIADQTFLRAEKSDVLTEDLLLAERRVDCIKAACQATHKRVAACTTDFGSETSLEKRLRKIPQILLGASMLESGCNFTRNSILGDTLRECATVQTRLGSELFDHCTEVEKNVLKPVSAVLDNEVHNISKLRKQLGKLVLDMDSARTRFATAERHSLAVGGGGVGVGKVDTLKEEMEDAQQKVEQTRDALATEMFSLMSREPHLARLFLQLHQLQASYHRNALAALESSLPVLESLINDFSLQPVYGCSLEEHLRVTEREVGQVIETCVAFLMEYGLLEEGLLRIAGSALKVKKLKSAFDAGIELDMEEYVRDPHAVAGAFKSYLRELPEPLLTHALYNDWMNAAKEADFDSKLQALWQVLHRLPAAHFKNLKYVIKFLAKVQENMDVNKMSSQNIAIVMAPNLIWSATEESTTIGMNMSTASLHTSIVDMLISYADWFFPEDAESAPPHPSNMNESHCFDKEVNGNNPDVLNSPRSPHNKNFRKPAAPPPPAERSGGTPPLIDLLGDHEGTKKPPAQVADTLKGDVPVRPAIPPSTYSSFSLDRKSLRNHPSRPARPPSDAMTRSVHVERPSVPPPERPDKTKQDLPSATEDSLEKVRILSSPEEKAPGVHFSNAQGSLDGEVDILQPQVGASKEQDIPKQAEGPPTMQKPNRVCEVVHNPPDADIVPKAQEVFKSQREVEAPVTVPRSSKAPQEVLKETEGPLSPRPTKVPDPNELGDSPVTVPRSKEVEKPPTVPRASKAPKDAEGHPPCTVQRSRSASKMNRFDFLVSQREDRPPPERPPRSMESSEPASPKGPEVEKVKPPRPQPPAKPKLNLVTENTNL